MQQHVEGMAKGEAGKPLSGRQRVQMPLEDQVAESAQLSCLVSCVGRVLGGGGGGGRDGGITYRMDSVCRRLDARLMPARGAK